MIVLGRTTPLVVGHRGGRGGEFGRENTIEAFDLARRQGARAIEADLRPCADDVVVLHDPTLEAATGGQDGRRVEDLHFRELDARGLGIPRLADLLAWAERAGMALNLEIKRDVPDRLRLVRAVAREARGARVPLLLSSFDPWILLSLRAVAPELPRALLTDPRQSYAAALHALARPRLLFGLHVERTQADPGRIVRWKERGLAVGVWTVNDPQEARALARDGVDLLITDRPGVLARALGS